MGNNLGESKTSSHTHVNVSSPPRYAKDEAVLARFGKRQQLRVSLSLVDANTVGSFPVTFSSHCLDPEKLWPPAGYRFD